MAKTPPNLTEKDRQLFLKNLTVPAGKDLNISEDEGGPSSITYAEFITILKNYPTQETLKHMCGRIVGIREPKFPEHLFSRHFSAEEVQNISSECAFPFFQAYALQQTLQTPKNKNALNFAAFLKQCYGCYMVGQSIA